MVEKIDSKDSLDLLLSEEEARLLNRFKDLVKESKKLITEEDRGSIYEVIKLFRKDGGFTNGELSFIRNIYLTTESSFIKDGIRALVIEYTIKDILNHLKGLGYSFDEIISGEFEKGIVYNDYGLQIIKT